MELGDSYGRIWERIEGPNVDKNSIGSPTELTKMEPWVLPDTELPTKEHTWAGPSAPRPHVADV